MGRLVTSMMAGDPAAANSIARSWERWSRRCRGRSGTSRGRPGRDAGPPGVLEEGLRPDVRLMTDSAMAQMRMVSRMGLSPEPEGPTASMRRWRHAGHGHVQGHLRLLDGPLPGGHGPGHACPRGRGDAAGRARGVQRLVRLLLGLLKQVMATPTTRAPWAPARRGMDAIKRSREASEAASRPWARPRARTWTRSTARSRTSRWT